MDRNAVIATVLIGLILLVWLYLMPTPPPQTTEQAPAETQETETVEEPRTQPTLPTPPPSLVDSTLAGAQQGTERFLTVETDLYQARFSTKGGTLVSFTLKEYKQFDQKTPIQLIDSTSNGAVGLVFTTPSSHVVDTRAFFFEPSLSGDVLNVADAPTTLSFVAQIGTGAIRQTYTFTPGEYEVGLQVVQENASSFLTNEGYELMWYGGVPFSEDPKARATEANSLSAHARSGGEVEGITLNGETYEEQTLRGDISWVAVKNKYFTNFIIPKRTPREAELIGEQTGRVEDHTLAKHYTASMLMSPPPAEGDTFLLYLGPLEFYRITKYDLGLYGMVDYGWDFFEIITRPLAKFVFIPVFTFLSGFIPNYGLVIIIFAFLIKVLLFPLTRSSFRSMAKMRDLQPKMEEIKTKYADNPQKQQEAMMKLYREMGVNPLGGCLPMLLQYPIIIALWQFLQQSIEIRQQGFLWANDLSAPDVILNLPFSLPLYGDFVAGFTILMGLSMILQMRMQATPSSGPQAKMMMYMMPAVIFVMFNQFPSGLSLYYLCYNIFTALQQQFIDTKKDDKQKATPTVQGVARSTSKKKSN